MTEALDSPIGKICLIILDNMKKYNIGLTWGAFDLLHIGHVNLLQKAKAQCIVLFVCVSNDEYILKHKGRLPIIPYLERINMVTSLRCVDLASFQTFEFDKVAAVVRYSPDVLFVGDDWTPKTYTGEGLGVPGVYLPHTKVVSTTSIIKRIKQR